jgi:linoleoyl-CoA desaturase
MQRQSDYGLKLAFNPDNSFEKELRRRVKEYFAISGKKPRDCMSMYVKTATILTTFFITYLLLVFAANNAWQALSLSVLLGFATAGIGFTIQHDGGHRAYSNHQWVNRLMAMTMDLIGGSSYVWWWKHTRIHHRFVNITGYDTDIEIGYYGRMSPHQKHLPIHRWQHLYLWLLYGLLAIKWHLFDDFKSIISGRLAMTHIPRPKGWELVTFVSGKLVFFSLAFFIPLIYHPWWQVLIFYGIAAVVLGMLMSLVFQIPHCVMEAEFPLPDRKTGQIAKPWAIHQVSVTLDFNRSNSVLTWLVGGLNCHMEHHLFPIICHVNYPALTKIVRETCDDFGISYKEHVSFVSGLTSHFRFLKALGQPIEQA